MSAAATAAGYLYASGRLRGRGAREQEQQQERNPEHKSEHRAARKEVRVAVLPEPEEHRSAAPRKTPKIEYKRKRLITTE
jgi:hypothetical protein